MLIRYLDTQYLACVMIYPLDKIYLVLYDRNNVPKCFTKVRRRGGIKNVYGNGFVFRR